MLASARRPVRTAWFLRVFVSVSASFLSSLLLSRMIWGFDYLRLLFRSHWSSSQACCFCLCFLIWWSFRLLCYSDRRHRACFCIALVHILQFPFPRYWRYRAVFCYLLARSLQLLCFIWDWWYRKFVCRLFFRNTTTFPDNVKDQIEGFLFLSSVLASPAPLWILVSLGWDHFWYLLRKVGSCL